MKKQLFLIALVAGSQVYSFDDVIETSALADWGSAATVAAPAVTEAVTTLAAKSSWQMPTADQANEALRSFAQMANNNRGTAAGVTAIGILALAMIGNAFWKRMGSAGVRNQTDSPALAAVVSNPATEQAIAAASGALDRAAAPVASAIESVPAATSPAPRSSAQERRIETEVRQRTSQMSTRDLNKARAASRK